MKTITVKGVGAISVHPDQTVIHLELKNKKRRYEAAMEDSAKQIAELSSALAGLGFEKTDLKTTTFDVDTSYEGVKDRNGNYKRIFDGYEVSQRLKLEFPLDVSRLGQVLAAIAACEANPELSIAFTVKEPSAVSEELLRAATVNAREKARILCESADVRLGELLQVDYHWEELSLYSHTTYEMNDRCFSDAPCAGIGDMAFEPDDIDVRDTVTFVWAIA